MNGNVFTVHQAANNACLQHTAAYDEPLVYTFCIAALLLVSGPGLRNVSAALAGVDVLPDTFLLSKKSAY